MQRKTKTTTTTTNATATHDGKRTQHTESGLSCSHSGSQNTMRNLSQAGKERTKERERMEQKTAMGQRRQAVGAVRVVSSHRSDGV